MSKPPLLWHSNASWSTTGYGAQTALFCPKLAEQYEVGISAFYGLEGAPLEHLSGIPTYPGISGQFGNEQIVPHARTHFKPKAPDECLIVTLMDVWVLDANIWKALKKASWVPIDHDPAPPLVAQWFNQSDAIPIAMSRFGEELLSDFDPLYCPHAVDTKDYVPKSQKNSREKAQLPQDAFIVGMVAANKGQPSRKSFPSSLIAFKAFAEKHDDAMLYLHTEMMGQFEGVNLPALIKSLKLEDRIILTDQYRYLYSPIPPTSMASIYSALDVLLNPAKGEGFGLPVLEAQACGTPVIVTDFSAMKEVCGAGWKVGYLPSWTPQMSWMAEPNIDDIVAALESAYAMPAAARKGLRKQAREHALTYDIEKIMADHMFPALTECRERLGLVDKVAA